MRCVSNKYVFIDFEASRKGERWRTTKTEEEAEDKEGNHAGRAIKKNGGCVETFGGAFNPLRVREERVGCLAGEPEARVAFTLADINGFQPIRAKWNG